MGRQTYVRENFSVIGFLEALLGGPHFAMKICDPDTPHDL